MSWIFGAFGNISEDDKENLNRCLAISLIQGRVSNKLYFEENRKYWVTAGGFEGNFFNGNKCYTDLLESSDDPSNFKRNYSEDSHWLAVGIGIVSISRSYKMMTWGNWEEFLSDPKRNIKDLNGHFCFVVFNENEIKIFTDQLGTRDIFFIHQDEFIVFSTNLDLIIKFKGGFEYDFRAMGSLWLLESQINTGCIFKDIIRLTSSAMIHAKCYNKLEISYEESPWIPKKMDNVDVNEIYEKLIEFSFIPFRENAKILLALSGGMDSRILLSILLDLFDNELNLDLTGYELKNLETFTFGMNGDLDVEIPKVMSSKLGFGHNIYFNQNISPETNIKDLSKFILDTKLTFPASEFLLKRNYELLLSDNSFIIDGCWGEITRRSLFKRLIALAPNEIHRRDARTFFKFMSYPHADIFNEEVSGLINQGALEHLENSLNSMPELEDFTMDSWMDLFALRTKQPNLVGVEQSRIDNLVKSYSPFAQPDFFNLIFATDQKIKKNGSIIKLILKSSKKRLDSFPLNAGGVKIPFSYSSSSIVIKKKLLSFLNKKRVSYRSLLINNFKEILADIINSISFVNFEFYDKKKINSLLTNQKKGQKKAEQELDWFLAFELYRRGLNNE